MTAEQFRKASKVRKNRGVEQLVARGTHNPKVAGSSPAPATSEARIHEAFCKYVATKYPTLIFTSESSGIRLTMGQAVKAKKLRSSSKLPDFWLAEPRGPFHGFFLELKRSRAEVYRKDGTLIKKERIHGQAVMIARLQNRGYYADFGFGLDDCIKKLDQYMERKAGLFTEILMEAGPTSVSNP